MSGTAIAVRRPVTIKLRCENAKVLLVKLTREVNQHCPKSKPFEREMKKGHRWVLFPKTYIFRIGRKHYVCPWRVSGAANDCRNVCPGDVVEIYATKKGCGCRLKSKRTPRCYYYIYKKS